MDVEGSVMGLTAKMPVVCTRVCRRNTAAAVHTAQC